MIRKALNAFIIVLFACSNTSAKVAEYEPEHPRQILFILDAAASMQKGFKDVPQPISVLNAGKELIEKSIDALPADLPCRLIVLAGSFDHKNAAEVATRVTDLGISSTKNERHKLIRRLHDVHAVGDAPLGIAIKDIWEKYIPSEGQQIVVIVTDESDEDQPAGVWNAYSYLKTTSPKKVSFFVVSSDWASEDDKFRVKRPLYHVASDSDGRYYGKNSWEQWISYISNIKKGGGADAPPPDVHAN